MSAEHAPRGALRRAALVVAVAVAATACSADRDDASGGATTDASTSTAADESVESAPVSSSVATTGSVEPTVEPLRVGLVAPSTGSDRSFTQSMVDSLDRLAADGEVVVSATTDTPRADDALASAAAYAGDGVDLVILHGSQYRSAVEQLAADHPDVVFAWGTAANTVDLPNVVGYTAHSDQGGYVNGVIAAGLTESGIVGAIGPVQVGDAGRYVDGFVLGARAANPEVQVSVNFIESYTDTVLAAEAATVMADFGADVLTGTSQIVAGPIEVAVERGLPWLATQSDPADLAQDQVAASQVYHWEVVLGPLLDGLRNGRTSDDLEPLTLANGGLVIVFNDGFDLPEDVRTAAEQTIDGLAAGSLTTGVG